jgi:predicted PurR-regulated permease PerM
LIISIIIIPVSFLGGALLQQAQSSFDTQYSTSSLIDKISSNVLFERLDIDLESLREKGINFFINILTSTAKQIPSFVISIFVMIVSIYYILINWNYLSEKIRKYIPFKNKEKISKDIAYSTKHIVYGYFLIAILEFIVGAIGFWLSGVQYYLLLPSIMALLAFIPGLGPGMVWVPLIIVNLISGDYLTALGVLLTGLTISILIETIFFGKIIGKQAKIHPLIILIGVFGGVPLFGIFGFIIGPLILSYTLKLLEELLENKKY